MSTTSPSGQVERWLVHVHLKNREVAELKVYAPANDPQMAIERALLRLQIAREAVYNIAVQKESVRQKPLRRGSATPQAPAETPDQLFHRIASEKKAESGPTTPEKKETHTYLVRVFLSPNSKSPIRKIVRAPTAVEALNGVLNVHGIRNMSMAGPYCVERDNEDGNWIVMLVYGEAYLNGSGPQGSKRPIDNDNYKQNIAVIIPDTTPSDDHEEPAVNQAWEQYRERWGITDPAAPGYSVIRRPEASEPVSRALTVLTEHQKILQRETKVSKKTYSINRTK